MRVSLPAGDWVDLVDRINHAQYRRVKRAAAGDKPDSVELETETVAALAANWSLHDVAGREIPFPGGTAEGVAAAALDTWPYEAVIEAFAAAAKVIQGVPDPNATAASSDTSLPAPS